MISVQSNIKKIIVICIWMLVAAACITLLVSAMRSKSSTTCNGLVITISGVNNHFFIDKNDIYKIIKQNGGDSTKNNVLSNINIKYIEAQLEKEEWIKNAELFFDNNNILNVSVVEREPIARLFSINGNSFYMDSSCKILPLSNKFSARLPLFTSYPSNNKITSSSDSILLQSIKTLSINIVNDSFLMALIEQVDILPNQNFEFIPKVGNQKIYLGTATDVELKLKKLKLFYKNVIAQVGWNKYSAINLQYKNQVVASVRGAADIMTDSLQTLLIMKTIVENAKLKSADSAQTFIADADKNNNDTSIISQSTEREEEGAEEGASNIAPIIKVDSTQAFSTLQKTVAKLKVAASQPLNIPIKPPIKNPVAIAVAKKATAVATKQKPLKLNK